MSWANKLLSIALGVIITVSLTACAPQQSATDTRFGDLGSSSIHCRVIMDHVTGVYYLVVTSRKGGIAITPLLNPDGTPERVDNVDYLSVKPDIDSNTIDWIGELLENQQ